MAKKAKLPARSKFYSQIGAQGWHKSGYDTFTYDSPAFRRWITAQLGLKSRKILSIGCGAGELERDLAAAGHAVTGLDLSHAMLVRASRKSLDGLVAADARHLPFGEAQFDIVMIMESIGYLALDDVFPEARRVLKKRGRFLITTYGATIDAHARYHKWRLDEVTDSLIKFGFRIDEKQYLDVKKSRVRDAASAEKAGLLYLSSRLKNRPALPKKTGATTRRRAATRG
jgi:ubiquinone/menaquinone biosynthesis C-methylase UbiE